MAAASKLGLPSQSPSKPFSPQSFVLLLSVVLTVVCGSISLSMERNGLHSAASGTVVQRAQQLPDPVHPVAHAQAGLNSIHTEDMRHVWPYTCWTPKTGLATPTLTMVSVLGGLPINYTHALRQNRLAFAAQKGYRYCELQTMDRFKIPAFTKLPWMLALSPCSEYIIHLDGDAMINNMSLSFQPWMEFMDKHDLDQLFSADCIRQSAINYGVFMIRTAPWLWNFYKKIYNLCVCDWARMNDWPAEQGVVYDLLAQDLNSPETKRSMIVPGKGWNHILDPGALPEKEDVVVHLTYPSIYPDGHPCKNATHFTRECKYVGLEHFLTKVIGSSQHLVADSSVLFDVGNNTCLNVRYNKLSGPNTYSNYGHRAQSASVLDFDVDPRTGKAIGVKLSEVGCLGFRETKCDLPELWDKKQGRGPWTVSNVSIV